jgi:hypothetical protein
VHDVLFALPCSEFRHGFGVTGRYSTDFANVSAASARPFCRKQERTAGKRASGTPAWREASAPPSLAPAQTQTFRFRVFEAGVQWMARPQEAVAQYCIENVTPCVCRK